MGRRGRLAFGLALLLGGACRSARGPGDELPAPDATPLPAVKQAAEEVVVAAWAEPSRLQEGGGVTQILVRLQKRNRQPYPGVEVRLQTSHGRLFTQGRILVTDARGMTRDRLTTRATAKLTLNAGGTRYTFKVPVAPDVINH